MNNLIEFGGRYVIRNVPRCYFENPVNFPADLYWKIEAALNHLKIDCFIVAVLSLQAHKMNKLEKFKL